MYFVTVTDQAAGYIYGPFFTRAVAEAFAAKHKNDFFGRTVHVSMVINPNEENADEVSE